jgi:hypothetical protein
MAETLPAAELMRVEFIAVGGFGNPHHKRSNRMIVISANVNPASTIVR